jgi:hypothetical protein
LDGCLRVGANGEFGIQADKTNSTPGIEKKETSYGRKPEAPTSGYRAYVLKVSDISRAAQYFVSLGLRPIHQGQGIAVLELRGGTHLVLRPSDESIPAGMVDDIVATREQYEHSWPRKRNSLASGIRRVSSALAQRWFNTAVETILNDG